MKTITVLANQTLFDIALQVYGDIDGVFDLCRDNDIQFFEPVEAGQAIVIREENIINKNIVKYYKRHGICPASGVIPMVSNWILATGGWNDNGKWQDNKFWKD